MSRQERYRILALRKKRYEIEEPSHPFLRSRCGSQCVQLPANWEPDRSLNPPFNESPTREVRDAVAYSKRYGPRFDKLSNFEVLVSPHKPSPKKLIETTHASPKTNSFQEVTFLGTISVFPECEEVSSLLVKNDNLGRFSSAKPSGAEEEPEQLDNITSSFVLLFELVLHQKKILYAEYTTQREAFVTMLQNSLESLLLYSVNIAKTDDTKTDQEAAIMSLSLVDSRYLETSVKHLVRILRKSDRRRSRQPHEWYAPDLRNEAFLSDGTLHASLSSRQTNPRFHRYPASLQSVQDSIHTSAPQPCRMISRDSQTDFPISWNKSTCSSTLNFIFFVLFDFSPSFCYEEQDLNSVSKPTMSIGSQTEYEETQHAIDSSLYSEDALSQTLSPIQSTLSTALPFSATQSIERPKSDEHQSHLKTPDCVPSLAGRLPYDTAMRSPSRGIYKNDDIHNDPQLSSNAPLSSYSNHGIEESQNPHFLESPRRESFSQPSTPGRRSMRGEGAAKSFFPDGRVVLRLPNGDLKTTYPDGKTSFYYAAARATMVKYPNKDSPEGAALDVEKEAVFESANDKTPVRIDPDFSYSVQTSPFPDLSNEDEISLP